MRKGRRQKDKGAAAVEFALVLPILLLFVMGTIEWGWFFFTHQRVVNAAREGARAGTLLTPGSQPGAVRTAAENAAADYLVAVGLQSQGATIVANPVYGMPDTTQAVQVVITYPYQSLTQFPGVSSLIPSQFRYVAVMRWQ